MAEWMTASHFLVFILLYVHSFYIVYGVPTTRCRKGRFGGACQYTCHCLGNRVCNRNTGKCFNFACSKGWSGRACQQQNVALGRKAWQTTTLCQRNTTANCHNASRAVDGVTNSYLNNGSCSASLNQTSDGNSEQWFVVELDKVYTVYRLQIFNRQDCCGEKLTGFSVFVYSPTGQTWHLCHSDNSPTGSSPAAVLNITCQKPIKGNKVAIVKNGTVVLCELKVLVCSAGWYGDQCQYPCKGKQCQQCDSDGINCTVCGAKYFGAQCEQRKCEHCWDRSRCDRTVGLCYTAGNKTCRQGWHGPRCNEECTPGRYGADCARFCGKCWSGAGCRKTDGFCISKGGQPVCELGHKKPRCRKYCVRGTFGQDCMKKCGHCRDKAPCDRLTGNCPSNTSPYLCNAGWRGAQCSNECPKFYYGDGCNTQCGKCWQMRSCNHVTGLCPSNKGRIRCILGWHGKYCNVSCPPGFYGDSCALNCGNCYNQQPCLLISGVCPKNSSIPSRCQPGWKGRYCKVACSDGYYGYDCKQKCGRCFGTSSCLKDTGQCRDSRDHVCQPGWTGQFCNVSCNSGTYGTDCSEVCGHCRINQTCNVTTGHCLAVVGQPLCKAAWTGKKCKTECSPGTWGPDCKSNCSGHCTENSPCNKDNGLCPEVRISTKMPHCQPGWTGKYCKQPCMPGFYAADCNLTCGKCWSGSICDRVTGHCPKTYNQPLCDDGYTGYQCYTLIEEADPHMSTGSIVGITLGVSLAVVIVAGLVALYFYRRKKTLEEGKKRHLNDYSREVELSTLIPSTNTTSMSSKSPSSIMRDKVEILSNTDPMLDSMDTTDLDYFDFKSFQPVTESVKIDSLQSYINDKKLSGTIKEEYRRLPSGLSASYTVAVKPENKPKNRFQNIYPYNHSRVVLDIVNEDPNSDYINASYIHGYAKANQYVACQGPTMTIVNDFWRMIWQLGSNKIIMLTKLVEDARRKCDHYWPEKEMGYTSFGLVMVKLLDLEQYADFTIRTFEMSAMGQRPRIVKQYHFTAWPDHGVPAYPTALIHFRNKVHNGGELLIDVPLIIHCSAGIGRTGTFIALDYLVNEAQGEQRVNIYGCILNLRKQRVNVIQTEEQYEFLHEALLESLQLLRCNIPSNQFCQVYHSLCTTINPVTNKTELVEQYDLLNTLSPKVMPLDCQGATSAENTHKNRFSSIVASDNFRPYLSTPIQGTSDYINAVFMPSYKEKYAFIVTQMPLPNTVIDFLRMLQDHKSQTIVMLNPVNTTDKFLGVYWPRMTTVENFGPFCIETIHVHVADMYLVRTLRLTYSNRRMTHRQMTVKQFECQFWPDGAEIPNSTCAMINVMQEVEKWQQQCGNDPITVHCMNGAERSGLYCVVSAAIERMKLDQELSMVEIVKQMRINRTQIISSLDQFKFCHEAICTYLENFPLYANTKT